MSCYGWEKGSVQLPVKEWKNFRDSIYSRYNQKLSECYELALKVYEEVKVEKKGKRNFPLEQRISSLISSLDNSNTSHYYNNWHFRWVIENSLMKNKKLVKPKKKDFTAKKTTKDTILEDQELRVRFDNKTRTVYYSTDDNNHSIDVGRESFLGSLVISKLERVSFTSKTGGYLRQQNEYDVDAGEGARTSATFGKYKTSKKFQRMAMGF